MDSYVTAGSPGGPASMVAKDAKGQTLETVQFTYDGSGKLIRESFVDSKGQPAGKAEYKRNGDQLTEELRFDRTGTLLSRTVFKYKDKDLIAMEVYNSQNALELRRTYTIQGGRITGGDEISDGVTDHFVMKYNDVARLLEALVFVQQDGHPFGHIAYRYDAQKRITERERVQVDKRELCRYEYDGAGRIIRFSYFVMQGDWRLQKTLTFTYP